MLVHCFRNVFVNINDDDDGGGGGGDDGIHYDDDEWTNDIKYLANFLNNITTMKILHFIG